LRSHANDTKHCADRLGRASRAP